MSPTTMRIGQARRAELQTLFNEHGTLFPQQVLEFARSNPDSALHGHFVWDNDEAAEQFRLRQARDLIQRTFTVVQVPGSGEERRIRMTVSLPADRGVNGYRLMTDVLAEPEGREALIKSAMRELAIFRRKYEALTELTEVFSAIDRVAPAA